MKAIQGIFAEYVKRRNKGLTQVDTLDVMRQYIEPLSKSNKREFITVMRAWERELQIQQRRAGIDLQDTRFSTRILEPLVVMVPPKKEMVQRHKNLPQSEKAGVTAMLNYPPPEPKRLERGSHNFTRNDVLEMAVKATGHRFQMHPRGNRNEVFIGRSALRGALAPDIDLSSCNGARLGVSQLHMSIEYNDDDHQILVYDLNSTNGSFLNGVSISPDVPQMLHDGDELRLGLLIINVSYRLNAAEEFTRYIS